MISDELLCGTMMSIYLRVAVVQSPFDAALPAPAC